MKIKDLGPFAVFRYNGRVFVKSSGMIQMLDRSGTLFDAFTGYWPDTTEVEPIDLRAPREGSTCLVCLGGGYEPGRYHDHAHGGQKKRCPNGCLVEGKPDPVPAPAAAVPTCECCARPLVETVMPEAACTASR